MASMPVSLPVFLCAAALLASPAIAGDFVIVPGQRIGSVRLGLSRQAVHQVLHAPKMVRRLPGGIIEESWLSHLTFAEHQSYRVNGLYWKTFFVNVYFRREKVAQVEVNSPHFHTLNGLSTNSSTAAFKKHYRPYHSSDHQTGPLKGRPLVYGTLDQSGGYPGYKHYVTIEDAIQKGIAWRYGAWGDLAPEPDPDLQEVIIVHRRGQPVILEPDAGNRFVASSHDPGFDK